MFRCINCKSFEHATVADLGMQPIVNNLLDEFDSPEPLFPLKIGKCLDCGHYSTGNPIPSEVIFTPSYPYRTGINEGYLKQCRAWADSLSLKKSSRILEIGCNDSSLLKIFRENDFLCLYGVDPTGIGESTNFITL